MKKLFLLLSLLMSVHLTYSQKKIDEYRYHTKDGSVSMSISSDNKYELLTAWSIEPYSDVSETFFYWGTGYIQHKNDTLICIDSTNYKKILVIKKSEDVVKIVDWKDYKNRDDETNSLEGWKGDYKNKFYLDDFLTRNNYLYLQTIYEGTSENRRRKLLKAYFWKDGKKRQVYEDGVGFIRE